MNISNMKVGEHAVITVREVRFNVLPMETRFPFKYGIAAMTTLPHLFVTVLGECDGKAMTGLSSEGLPPKWFTKNPATTFEEDLPLMLETILNAGSLVEGSLSGTFFELWKQLYHQQAAWAKANDVPPLLANLGVSLMERAVIDGVCRTLETCFGEALRSNVFGIELGDLRAELAGKEPADFLPEISLERITARHTVGLGDPLSEGGHEDAPRDGLPYTLEECIAAYGLDYFKVKLCGDLEKDVARLRELQAVFVRCASPDYKLTLDGNEQFSDIAAFTKHWKVYHEDEAIRDLLNHLLFVEQPLHRDRALEEEVREALSAWPEAPLMIIDESEADLTSLPRALDLGYAGTSHKNCKGIVKGIANACLLEHRRREDPAGDYILSGEDLANVGPVALLQDLAVMAAFGIEHVERNGHHYFKGLSM
ncbi:MAG: hypothetical protein OSB41_06225, partial [Kiritimatiellae bacterium]|nr:hypothetical protein [Kiritimatiellia bacterium]